MMPTLSVDEEGFFIDGENKIEDDERGALLQSALFTGSHGEILTQDSQQTYLVQAFDQPLVALDFSIEGPDLVAYFSYDTSFKVQLKSLYADEWDRFYGLTEKQICFAMSSQAQDCFFNLVDEFDDESFTWQGEKIFLQPHYPDADEIKNSDYWSQIYKQEQKPGWDLQEAAPAMKEMLPRLKLTKSRVLVLGCGEGHDAAAFAREGHLVTAVDFSEQAIERAQKRYGDLQGLKFICADAFKLPLEASGPYDLIFEHTFFCALPPSRRKALVKLWLQLLATGGHLMGVFFAVDKRVGPPFGSTELEIRTRLNKYFRFLFWGRWNKSIPSRQGRELFVYAQKR